MAVAIERADDQVGDLALLGAREVAQVLEHGGVEVDDVGRQAGADGDLVHVDVGRVQEVAALGQRHDGERVRTGLGGQRGAFERVDGDVHRRAAGADALADVEHRRLVHLALADDDRAVDGDAVEGAAHRLDGGAVGLVLLAQAHPARGAARGGLGDAHQVKRQVAIAGVVGVHAVGAHR